MISGRVQALNLTVPLGSGRVGSDDLGYGPGSGFSFEPVQTSMQYMCFNYLQACASHSVHSSSTETYYLHVWSVSNCISVILHVSCEFGFIISSSGNATCTI